MCELKSLNSKMLKKVIVFISSEKFGWLKSVDDLGFEDLEVLKVETWDG